MILGKKHVCPKLNCTPFVRQYEIPNNKWGVFVYITKKNTPAFSTEMFQMELMTRIELVIFFLEKVRDI